MAEQEQKAPPTREAIEAYKQRIEAHRIELARLPVMIQMAQRFGFGDDIIRFESTLIATVFPKPKPGEPAITTPQLLMFLNVASEHGLNPFKREIYAFPKDGAIVPMVPIDGWITIMQRHPKYNGHRFEYEWKDGKVGEVMVSARVIIMRKDTEPIEHTEYMVECVKDTQPWKKWPRRMLTHKAMIQGARYAFGLAGLYDPDEAERVLQGDEPDPTTRPAIAQPQRKSQQALPTPQKPITPDLPQYPQRETVPVGREVKRSPAENGADYQSLRDHAVPAQPEQAQDVIDDEPDPRTEPQEEAQEAQQTAPAGPAYIDFLADAMESKPEPAVARPEPELPSKPELTAPLQELFETGAVRKGSDVTQPEERKLGTIGIGQAKFLHMKLTRLKKRTEAELKDVLKDFGIEHLRDLPDEKEIVTSVERWIEGHDKRPNRE